MNKDYKATPEQWRRVDQWANQDGSSDTCILELRARVEALEAGTTCPHIVSSDEGTSYCRLAEQGATVKESLTVPPDPAGSLVGRVARLLAKKNDPYEMWYIDARAEIRGVATWLRKNGHASAAAALEQEVGQ